MQLCALLLLLLVCSCSGAATRVRVCALSRSVQTTAARRNGATTTAAPFPRSRAQTKTTKTAARARARAGAHLLAFSRVGSPLNRPPPASKKLALHTCTVGFAYVCRRDSPPSQWITLPVVNGSSVGDMTVATVRATSSAVTRRCGG